LFLNPKGFCSGHNSTVFGRDVTRVVLRATQGAVRVLHIQLSSRTTVKGLQLIQLAMSGALVTVFSISV
jgi:hypothetical protein